MKQAGVHTGENRSPGKRRWVWFGVCIPLTSALLIVSQVDVRSRFQLADQTFRRLEAPHRYAFSESLPRIRDLTVGIEQEIGFYQERVRQNPEGGLDRAALAVAYLKMARISSEGNWYLLADQTAQQSLAKLPFNNDEAVSVLARVAEARHDFAGALRLAQQVSDPKESIALQVTPNLALGELAAASQAADALVETTLSMSAFTLQALVREAQGRDQEALQSFQQALAVEEAGDLSNSARTRMLLGRFYYERGQLESAEALYREALHILPQNAQALMNLAQLKLRQRQYRAAERLYADVIASPQGNPTVFTPLILRGQAQIKALQGDRTGAVQDWDAAEALLRQGVVGAEAGAFGHRRDLARLLLERGRSSDIAEAVALMQAELQIRRDASTFDTYAWALSRAGRWQEARQAIQAAIATGTRAPVLFDRAAAIERALGNTALANAYSRIARDIDPTFDQQVRQISGLGSGLGS